MKTITENTLIPISLVIVFLGGVMWLSLLYAKSENVSLTVIRIEETQKTYTLNLQEINSRLSRIEGQLSRTQK